MDGIDQVLAGHLVVDTERVPAHGPVDLPLQLAASPGDRCLHHLAALVLINNGSRIGIRFDDWDLEDFTGLLANRQERAIGSFAVLRRAWGA